MKNFKLFGKLNIIDILIILVLIAAIVAVGVHFLKPEPEPVPVTNNAIDDLSAPTGRFTVLCSDVTPELADSIVASLEGKPQEFNETLISPRRINNSYKFLDGQITDCEILRRGDDTVEIMFTVEGNLTYNGVIVRLGSQDIRIGVAYTVKTFDFELAGRVITVEKLS